MERAAKPKLYAARAELVLVHNNLTPLGEYATVSRAGVVSAPDPILRLARANTTLDYDAGERSVVAIDLLPLTPLQRRRHRRRLAKKGARQARKEGIPGLGNLSDMGQPRLDHAGDVLFGEGQEFLKYSGGGGPGGKPELDLDEQRAQDALRRRLESFTAAFRIQVLIHVVAADKQKAE